MADEALTAAAAPVPAPIVAPTTAPGLRGPKGMSPRQNYSRVNTGAPGEADAGAFGQKSIMPKVGSVMSISMATRPRALNDMLKMAMESTLGRAKVAEEAKRQLQNLGDGDDDDEDDKKEKDSCMKTSSAETVSTDYALKLAAASDYICELLKEGADLGGSYTLSENTVGPGTGPNPLQVGPTTPSGPAHVLRPNTGEAGTNKPPTSPGVQKAHPQERGATQMENDKDRAPGTGDAPSSGSTKNAAPLSLLRKMAEGPEGGAPMEGGPPMEGGAPAGGAPGEAPEGGAIAMLAQLPPEALAALLQLAAQQGMLGGEGGEPEAGPPQGPPVGLPEEAGPKVAAPLHLLRKMAEDAVNPAKIVAGSESETSMPTSVTGQAGPPASGKERVPATAEGVADLTRRKAKSVPKSEMGGVIDEPMMSASHDNVLQQAFTHTGEAGAKISSAHSIKLAAARALLQNVAQGGK